jgi:hypothetical protein
LRNHTILSGAGSALKHPGGRVVYVVHRYGGTQPPALTAKPISADNNPAIGLGVVGMIDAR